MSPTRPDQRDRTLRALLVSLIVAVAVGFTPTMARAEPTLVATPSTDLVDGQIVSIALSDLPESPVRVHLCPASTDDPASCDSTATTFFFPDESANASGPFELSARISDPEGTITDCRVTPCQLVVHVFGGGPVPIARVPLHFDPAGVLPDPPTASLDRSTDLLDGDSVQLTGSGFRANGWIMVDLCADVTGSQTCRSLTHVDSDAAGAVDALIRIRAGFSAWGDGGTPTAVDCRTNTTCRLVPIPTRGAPPAPIPLHFDPTGDLLPAAQIIVTPHTDLVDGQTVDLSVTGAEPNQFLDVQTCAYDAADELLTCDWHEAPRADVNGSMTWSHTVRTLLIDRFSDGDEPIDCRVATCRVELYDSSTGLLLSVDLHFDPDGELLPPPTISISPTGAVTEGDEITITGDGFEPADEVTIAVCQVGGGCDGSTSYVEVEPSGSFEAPLTPWAALVAGTETVDCRAEPGCEVVARGTHPRDRAVAPISFAPATPPRGRYLDPVFDDVEITRDVVYRTTTDFLGNTIELKIDIYQPVGDSAAQRPAIMWMHAGWFSFGDKTQLAPYILESAKRGYVGIGLQYRLRSGVGSGDLTGAIEAADDAYLDAAAAVDWLTANADTYRIDPRAIIGAGYSAGAVLAYNLDWLPGAVPDLGAGDADRSGPRVAGVVAIAGLPFAGPSAGDTPVIGFHGSADDILPADPARNRCAEAVLVAAVCEWVEYPGGDHYIAIDQFRPIVRRSHDFLYEQVLAPLGYGGSASPPGVGPVRPEVVGPPVTAPTTVTGPGPTSSSVPTATGVPSPTTVPTSTSQPTPPPLPPLPPLPTAPSGTGSGGGVTHAPAARPLPGRATYTG